MMTLKLAQLPSSILGIYGPQENLLPERMRYLHPDAAASYLQMDGAGRRLRVSDMWRSAESSLQARREKRGVQPPAHSGHNFGFSIDVDVEWMMKQHHLGKAELDAYMNENGWYCHRKDHLPDSESWHFNFFGAGGAKYLAASEGSASTSAGLESMIRDAYGSSFVLGAANLQAALKSMKLYGGDIDGDLGPLSREAIRAFQRTWELPSTGTADADTQRLLAFVTCQRDIVTVAAPAPAVA